MMKKKSDLDVWLDDLTDRQNHLYKNVLPCPECNSIQVQVIKFEAPAKWKCRICKQGFTHEPETSGSDKIPSKS